MKIKAQKICPLCKKNQFRFYFKAGSTNYEQCKSCGLIITFKLPRTNYEDYGLDHYLKLEGYLKNAFRKQVKAIEKYKSEGRVLEIGSGMGFMMELLKEAGFQVEGIEPGEKLVTYSKKKKLKVRKGYFEQIKIRPQSFDVIVMNHVLEHIKDPVPFLSRVKKVLKKDGILLLQVPNIGSFEARIMREKWSYVVPNDHYLQFNHQTMQKALELANFQILEAKTTGLSNELDSLKEEIVRCLKDDQKRFVYYLVKYFPSFVENSFNQGSALWYIAR